MRSIRPIVFAGALLMLVLALRAAGGLWSGRALPPASGAGPAAPQPAVANDEYQGSVAPAAGDSQFLDGAVAQSTGAPGANPTDLDPGSNPLADANPAVRAFWVDAFHDGFKSMQQIDDLVARAVTGRYNTIIAEVLAFHDTAGTGHGAYWNSAYVPRAADIVGGIDPLDYLVAKAHAAGIQVHTWIVTYRVCDAWPPAGNSLLAAHPEWLMVPLANLGQGPAKVSGHYVFDPGSPEVQEHVLRIAREIIGNYAVDGFNLDYIRYEVTNAGYPADLGYAHSGLARYRRLLGDPNAVPDPNTDPVWDGFRRQTINEFVRRLRAEIPRVAGNPRQPVWLTADLICFGNAPATFENGDAYHLFQDWRYWMESGWLDAGVPMNYKRDWNTNEATWYRNWVNAAVGWSYQRHMVIGQANYLNPKARSVTQLQYALNHAAEGTCNYSYYGTADEDMNGQWENDWTWYAYVGNNLFTTPVALPALPWRDPASATEGTLFGRITHAGTQAPLDFAGVTVGNAPPVPTDGNGYYVATMLPAAPGGTAYNVTVSGGDCPDVHLLGVTILPGVVTVRNVEMCGGPRPGDMDLDGDIDFTDFVSLAFCLHGPGATYPPGQICLRGDADGDLDVDLADVANFQTVFGGGTD